MRPTKKVNTRYGNMMIFSDDPTIGRSLETYGEYCYPEVELILDYVDSDSIVLDVGANVGTHTLGIAPHVGRVVAFEADAENLELLKMNVSMQDKSVAQKISITHLALSNRTGKTSTVFDYGKTHLSNQGGDDVWITMLDNIRGFPRIDFIKIDVEGMELCVLQGARDTITYFKPNMLIEMQDRAMIPHVYDFLSSLGYSMYWFPVSTFNPKNHKHNSTNIFGSQHGVINWFVTTQSCSLQQVLDSSDTIEKVVKRQQG